MRLRRRIQAREFGHWLGRRSGLSSSRRRDLGPNRLVLFKAIERRFAWTARIATVMVALTGFFMTDSVYASIGITRALLTQAA
jgi:hypothetical protein